MPTIAEVRQKFPQYEDLSDGQLADALYRKYYSDLPRQEFDAKVGLVAPQGGQRIAQASAAGAPGPDIGGDLLRSTASTVLGTDPRGATLLGPLVSNDAGEFYEANGELKAISNQDFIAKGPDGELAVYARSPVSGPVDAARKVASAVAPGLAAGAPTRLPSAGAAIVPSQGQRVAEAAARQGIDPNLSTVTDSRIVRSAAAINRETPMASGIQQRAIEREAGQIAGRAEQLAAGVSPVRDVDVAGRSAREGMEAFRASAGKDFNLRMVGDADLAKFITEPARKSSFSKKAAALYEQVGRRLPDGLSGSASATQRTLSAIASRFDSPQLAQQFQNSFIGRLADNLKGRVTWKDLRQVRTEVRGLKARELSEAERTIGNAEIKRIESALTQDIYNLTRAGGGDDALKALQRADRFYAAGSARLDAARDLLKVKSDSALYQKIVDLAGQTRSADIKKLNQVRRSLGDDAWSDVAAVAIRNLGKPTAGAAEHAVNDFSIGSFVTNYARLSEKGKNILFGGAGRGDLKSALDDLARVSEGAKRTAQFSVPTGGGVGIGRGAGQASVIGLGILDGWTSAALAVLGTAGLAKIMTTPALVRAMTRAMRVQAGPDSTRKLPAELERLRQLLSSDPAVGQYADALVARLRGEGEVVADDKAN